MAKAINTHGEAKAFARLVVKSLGDFKRNEEFIQMEEKLIQPTFKETFQDRKILEGVSTKFECIVIGKPSPKVGKLIFFFYLRNINFFKHYILFMFLCVMKQIIISFLKVSYTDILIGMKKLVDLKLLLTHRICIYVYT